MVVQLPHRRFTVDDYYRMGKAGILTEDDRVELLDGEIVEMSPIGSPHAGGVTRCMRVLTRLLGDWAVVAVQNPVRLGPLSEPQPDVAVLKPRPDLYADSHPTPKDVFLIVEVADTSATADRQVKLPLYARAGIPEVWLLVVGTGRRAGL